MRNLILIVLGLSFFTLASNAFATTYIVDCESRGFGVESYCYVPEPIKEVNLMWENGPYSCTYEITWDYTRDYIWVYSGCNARFEVITEDTR